MIILPPEEKKPASPLVKWTFRLLFTAVVLATIALIVLKLLSGTGEAHKRGLEKAISDVFGGPATIGTLHTFNIFPKFHIEMEDVRIAHLPSAGEMQAGRVTLVFRFFDILFKRDMIEDVQITGFTATSGVIGAHGLRVSTAGIVPATKDRPASFSLQGDYGDVPLSARLELQSIPGVPRPVYKIMNGLPAEFTLGSFAVSGKFQQNDRGEPLIRDAQMRFGGSDIASGSLTLRTAEKETGMDIEFETKSGTSGRLMTQPSEKAQSWSFATLHLSDVVADKPLWADVAGLARDMAPRASTPGANGNDITAIEVEIKKLQGDISGENLRGRFISSPDRLAGWWDGQMTQPGNGAQKVPSPSSVVRCGLLSMSPQGSVWRADAALVLFDTASLKAALEVDEESGHVSGSVERLAGTQDTTFGLDLSQIESLAPAFSLPDGHPCRAILDKAADKK